MTGLQRQWKQLGILAAACIAALGLATAGTQASWVLIDDFEHTAFENDQELHGVNDWSTVLNNSVQSTGNIRTNEFDDNMVMRLIANSNSSTGRRGAFKSLIAPSVASDMSIADDSVSTVFFRFYVEGGEEEYTHAFGLTDNAAPSAFNHFRLNLRIENGQLQHQYRTDGAGSSLNTVTLGNNLIADDTWYNIWLVVNNAEGHENDSFSVYLTTGINDATQDDLVAANLLFREGTSSGEQGIDGSLNTFFIFADQAKTRPVRYDDIYISSGQALFNPIPEPATLVLVGLGGLLMLKRKRH